MSELDAVAKSIMKSASMALAQHGANITIPAVAGYRDWTFGIGQSTALPRDPLEFMMAAFGPGNPRDPIPINVPEQGEDRPEPRRFEYPVAWNLSGGKPGSEGLKLAPFVQLRAYADLSSMVRAAIEVRKQEILGIEWEIVPTREARTRMKQQGDAAQTEWVARKDEATRFFKRPDPEYQNYHAWMSAFLEDLFVVDAATLYLHPPRVRGRGVLGSNLAALEVIDGTTIRPMLNAQGARPAPPNPAYQQYIWGVPRTDLMQVIMGHDLVDYDAQSVGQYDGEQLLYLPYIRRSWTPYGFPGIERALLPVVTGLKKQQFALEFFTEGSIPGMFVSPGPGIDTPEQIRKLQDTLNFLAGDQAWKHKIIVLPHGSTTEPHKPLELATSYDETVAVEICMAYEVNPNEIGYPMGMHAKGLSIGGSATAAETGDEARQRKATKPLLRWLKASVFNFVLQEVLGQSDMEWSWVGWQDEDDMAQKSERMLKEVMQGTRTIDEYRTETGQDPFGKPLTSEPIIISTRDGGITPLGFLDPQKLADLFMDPAADKEKGSGTNSSGADAQSANASTSTSGGGSDDEGGQKKVVKLMDALAELDKLRRAVKKRGPEAASEWEPEHLPAEVVARIAAGAISWEQARAMLRAASDS